MAATNPFEDAEGLQAIYLYGLLQCRALSVYLVRIDGVIYAQSWWCRTE